MCIIDMRRQFKESEEEREKEKAGELYIFLRVEKREHRKMTVSKEERVKENQDSMRLSKNTSTPLVWIHCLRSSEHMIISENIH